MTQKIEIINNYARIVQEKTLAEGKFDKIADYIDKNKESSTGILRKNVLFKGNIVKSNTSLDYIGMYVPRKRRALKFDTRRTKDSGVHKFNIDYPDSIFILCPQTKKLLHFWLMEPLYDKKRESQTVYIPPMFNISGIGFVCLGAQPITEKEMTTDDIEATISAYFDSTFNHDLSDNSLDFDAWQKEGIDLAKRSMRGMGSYTMEYLINTRLRHLL